MKQAESYIASAAQRPNYCLTVLKVRPRAAAAAVAITLPLPVNRATALPLISRARLGCTACRLPLMNTLCARTQVRQHSSVCMQLLAYSSCLQCGRCSWPGCRPTLPAYRRYFKTSLEFLQRLDPAQSRPRLAVSAPSTDAGAGLWVGVFKTGGGPQWGEPCWMHRSWWRRRRRHWRCGRRQA